MKGFEYANIKLRDIIVWDQCNSEADCLLPDEMINTLDGYKKIKDIKKGDFVFTHQRRYKKVIRTFKRKYTGKLYKIRVMGLPIFYITENHPLLISLVTRRTVGSITKKRGRDPTLWMSSNDLYISGHKDWLCCVPVYYTQYHASRKGFNARLEGITGIPFE